jgi:hypothetical protein
MTSYEDSPAATAREYAVETPRPARSSRTDRTSAAMARRARDVQPAWEALGRFAWSGTWRHLRRGRRLDLAVSYIGIWLLMLLKPG